MEPNDVNALASCSSSEENLREGLQEHVTINQCPECERYLQAPKTWIAAQIESKELLGLCVNTVNEEHLVEAQFIWTEPHSKRIKVMLKVEKEVLPGAILKHAYSVEFVIHDELCETCSHIEDQANPDPWVAAVQLRHMRMSLNLEELILKHDAASRAICIRKMNEGVDLFFGNRSHALKFVEFLGKVVPTRSRSNKQLVCQDTKRNTYSYKHTFCVEICPICGEDLICLPPKLSANLGNLGPLVICTGVTNSIALLDPFTLGHCLLDADQYWRAPFKPLLTSRQLVEYMVLDVEMASSEVSVGGSKYAMADVQVARMSDFGKNDSVLSVRTHIGHLLKPGDHVVGFDLNDIECDEYKCKAFPLPKVVLLKKRCEEKAGNIEDNDTGQGKDY